MARDSMAAEPICTEAAPAPSGAYSQAIVVGGFAFLSGQGPYGPDGMLVTGSFADQARQVFANLQAVAEAAGGSLATAVRVGVYLRDLKDFSEMDDLYRELLPQPWPARTTIQTDLTGFEIEADAIIALS